MTKPIAPKPISKPKRRATDGQNPRLNPKTKLDWQTAYHRQFPSLSKRTVSQLAGLMASKNFSAGEGYLASLRKLQEIIPRLKTRKEKANADQLIRQLASRLAYEKTFFRRQNP